MKAVTWQGRMDMQVTEVPDPAIQDPTDVIVKVTSTGLCGSDLHLYDPLTPFMTKGDVVGHEAMGNNHRSRAGRVDPGGWRSRGRAVQHQLRYLLECGQGLHSQCETTQNREHGTGASLFGYSKLYGQVPGGQAEMLRVPFGDQLPIKVPDGSAGRSVPVPFRRATDRLAGRSSTCLGTGCTTNPPFCTDKEICDNTGFT